MMEWAGSMCLECTWNALALWREALAGGVVILVGFGLGWRLGASEGGWPVRIVRWWLEHVVRPLVRSRSWSRRAATIAANNSGVCAAMVVSGAAGHVAWLVVAGVGLGSGIALRLMLPSVGSEERTEEPAAPRRSLLMTVGFALNALEVPAILMSAGLSLAQGAMSLETNLSDALGVFGFVIVPLLMISAAGEALWMTVDRDFRLDWRRE